jgi:hypothetical protein
MSSGPRARLILGPPGCNRWDEGLDVVVEGDPFGATTHRF